MLIENKICLGCKKEFTPKKYRKLQKYCSHPCALKHGCNKPKTGKIFNCVRCNKEFYAPPSQSFGRKFCSHECAGFTFKEQYRKEGSTRRITNGAVTRKFVFSHKPKICQCCNYSEYVECLEIHHYDENRMNNKLENLIVLCVMCHKKYHMHILNKEQILGSSPITQAQEILKYVPNV